MQNPEYPDKIFKILYAKQESEATGIPLDSSYIVMVASDDPLRTLDETDSILADNSYSGSQFIASVQMAQLAYKYYRSPENGGLSGAPLAAKVKQHLGKYVEDTKIGYTLYEAKLSDIETITKEEADRERKNILIKQRNEESSEETKRIIDFSDRVYETVNDTPIEFTDINIISSDIVYQYSSTVSTFNLNDIVLSEILPFVSNMVLDPETEKIVFQCKIYDHAKRLERLLESATESRQSNLGLRLSFYQQPDYITGIYNPNTYQLTIPGVRAGVFSDSVPQTDLIDEMETNLTINWTLYDVKIELELFLLAIMSNRTLRTYLAVNEGTTPSFMRLRKSIFFIYEPGKYVEIGIESQKLYSDKTVSIMTPVEIGEEREVKVIPTPKRFRVGSYYINFTMEKVPNIVRASSIQHLLSYLVYYYATTLQPKLISDYQNTFPGAPEPTFIIISQRGAQGGSRISKLQSADKEKFPEGYARRCLGDRQVDVITAEERDILAQEAKETGKIFEAEQFPKKEDVQPGEQVVIVTCPSEKFPYIGFKKNLDLPNRDKYKWIPCCYKKSQKASASSRKKTGYMRYMGDEEEEDDIGTLQTTIRSEKETLALVDKLLGFGRRAAIPNIMLRAFRNYGFEEEIQRDGVYKSVNSFAHCVMYAIAVSGLDADTLSPDAISDATKYLDTQSLIDREKFVAKWRQKVAEQVVYRSAVKQELFDYTDEEIEASLTNAFESFDSYLYTRLLEVYFGVQIYVFSLQYGQHSYPQLEVPRHRYIHIKTFNNSPAIVIFKHYNQHGIVNYELITFHTSNISAQGDNIFVLTDETKKKNIFRMYKEMYSVSTYINNDFIAGRKKAELLGISGEITGYKNIFTFDIYRYLTQIGLRPIAQYLDHYGKCRGYLIEVQSVRDSKAKVIGSILCYPQPPMALPVETDVISWSFDLIVTLFAASPIVRIDGTTSERETTELEELRGLWFSIDEFELGMYTPLIPLRAPFPEQASKIMSKITKRAANPLVPISTNNGPFSDFVRVQEQLKNILSIISWLYRLYHQQVKYPKIPREKQNDQKTIEEANTQYEQMLLDFRKLFKVDTKITHYDLASIVKEPPLTTLAAALKYLEEASNRTLVRGGSIMLQSEKLKEDLSFYVSNFLVKQPPEFYQKKEVHKRQRLNERVFQSFEEFESWVSTLTRPPTVIVDAEEISPYLNEPLVYRAGVSADSPSFIIQNVKDGDLGRALGVTIEWRSGRNAGYQARATTETEINYHILELMGRELAIKKTVKSRTPSKYPDLYVLRLPTHSEAGPIAQYAAVLPLT